MSGIAETIGLPYPQSMDELVKKYDLPNPTFFTYDNKVAVAPIPDRGTQKKITDQGGVKVLQIEQKNSLYECTVLAHTADGKFKPPMTILVKGSRYAEFWNKEIFEFKDGTKFILMPYGVIEAFRTSADSKL